MKLAEEWTVKNCKGCETDPTCKLTCQSFMDASRRMNCQKLEGWVRVFQWEDKRQAVGKNGQFKKDSWTACQRSKVVCQAETLTCGI